MADKQYTIGFKQEGAKEVSNSAKEVGKEIGKTTEAAARQTREAGRQADAQQEVADSAENLEDRFADLFARTEELKRKTEELTESYEESGDALDASVSREQAAKIAAVSFGLSRLGAEVQEVAEQVRALDPQVAETLDNFGTGLQSVGELSTAVAGGFAAGGPWGAAIGFLLGGLQQVYEFRKREATEFAADMDRQRELTALAQQELQTLRNERSRAAIEARNGELTAVYERELAALRLVSDELRVGTALRREAAETALNARRNQLAIDRAAIEARTGDDPDRAADLRANAEATTRLNRSAQINRSAGEVERLEAEVDALNNTLVSLREKVAGADDDLAPLIDELARLSELNNPANRRDDAEIARLPQGKTRDDATREFSRRTGFPDIASLEAQQQALEAQIATGLGPSSQIGQQVATLVERIRKSNVALTIARAEVDAENERRIQDERTAQTIATTKTFAGLREVAAEQLEISRAAADEIVQAGGAVSANFRASQQKIIDILSDGLVTAAEVAPLEAAIREQSQNITDLTELAREAARRNAADVASLRRELARQAALTPDGR